MAAQLYQLQGRFDLALAIYLRQQQPAVFDFIQEHHLLPVLHERVAQLLSIDEERAVQLLMDQYDEIPASTVVPSIQASSKEEGFCMSEPANEDGCMCHTTALHMPINVRQSVTC